MWAGFHRFFFLHDCTCTYIKKLMGNHANAIPKGKLVAYTRRYRATYRFRHFGFLSVSDSLLSK